MRFLWLALATAVLVATVVISRRQLQNERALIEDQRLRSSSHGFVPAALGEPPWLKLALRSSASVPSCSWGTSSTATPVGSPSNWRALGLPHYRQTVSLATTLSVFISAVLRGIADRCRVPDHNGGAGSHAGRFDHRSTWLLLLRRLSTSARIFGRRFRRKLSAGGRRPVAPSNRQPGQPSTEVLPCLPNPLGSAPGNDLVAPDPISRSSPSQGFPLK